MGTKSRVTVSVLNKRHNAICYHRVRKAQAVVTLRLGCIPGEYNPADLLTNPKITLNMRHGMVESIFYNKVAVIKEKDEI